ncbi:MAG: SDR family oxidoreductase [Proteobacteria bacterium]|nr:SDR family oxidoreductase [Pseudomonadota bacterium]
MRVLVLGATGLIGEAIVRRLRAAGHDVTGVARDVDRTRARLQRIAWLALDLTHAVTPEAWRPILDATRPDAVVNSAGALQDGARDDVSAVQSTAMRALYLALPASGCTCLVQISATRATRDADTIFMQSKSEADDALRASALDWTILRPGLVIAPQAFGGTALLRALAAMPLILPVAFPESPVQTVAVGDVADAVLSVLEARVPSRSTYDLVEDEPQPLRVLVQAFRKWLGLPAARAIAMPDMVPRLMARVGDGLGWLGWRPPLRTTAIVELAAGIRGDPQPWREASGAPLKPLVETLTSLPSTVQERWFARCFLLKPVSIGLASLFWVATGLIALARPGAAAGVLTERGFTEALAQSLVIGGAIADFGLGIAVLFRAWSAKAALGMLLLAMGYLLAGSAFAPDLWLDPLGPLLKALPVLMLSLTILALSDDR